MAEGVGVIRLALAGLGGVIATLAARADLGVDHRGQCQETLG